jgi:predicted DNA-binding ribbon-helix-helix protein
MSIRTCRVISIHQKRTSIRLSAIEWEIFEKICQKENIKRKLLLELIDLNKDENFGLTSAIRLFCIIYQTTCIKDKEENREPSLDSDTFYNPIFEAIKGIV